MARDPERTREAILSAAESLVAEKGIQPLTLEEIAARASISKGGLLHHFPSKHALITGLAAHMIASYEEELETLRRRDDAAPGAFTRAYLRANLAFADHCSQICATLTAEARNFPGMVTLFQQHWSQCQKRLEADGLDPVVATTVRYAVEGITSAATWGMPRPSNFEEVVNHLLKLSGGRPRKPAVKKGS